MGTIWEWNDQETPSSVGEDEMIGVYLANMNYRSMFKIQTVDSM